MAVLNESEQCFAARAVRRKRLFFVLSWISVAVALGLTVYSVWAATHEAGFDSGIHVVLVILILLNARQNLRQYRYAAIIEKLLVAKADN
jgi:hypothetical protein